MKKNVVCELVMTTYDDGTSLSSFVAKVTKEIKNFEKVNSKLTAMGTILEGDWNDVNALINHLFGKFSDSQERLVFTFKVDFKKGRENRIIEKVKAVRDKLKQ